MNPTIFVAETDFGHSFKEVKTPTTDGIWWLKQVNMAVRKRSQIFGTAILTLLFWLLEVTSGNSGVKTLHMLMPDVQPPQNETYLCTAFQMPKREFEYIVEFHPSASTQIAYHILIFGCELPGKWRMDSPRYVWDCAEMNHPSAEYSAGPVCKSGSQIIYTWAMGTPPLKLPEGVGFKVGKGTGIAYLVLLVHYPNANHFLNGKTDNSGIILTILPSKNRRVTKDAGVYLLGTRGTIPAHSEVYMETACEINEPIELHPFAFRTHTHALGRAVSGYKIDPDGNWHLIGKHNPQEPQVFYPVEDQDLVIQKGDILAARCTMYNYREHTTYIGEMKKDEMCLFHIMYYVDGDKPLQEKYCFSAGPPDYSWNWDPKIRYVPRNIDKRATILSY